MLNEDYSQKVESGVGINKQVLEVYMVSGTRVMSLTDCLMCDTNEGSFDYWRALQQVVCLVTCIYQLL